MYIIKLLDYIFSHPLKFYILNIKDVILCHDHMCKSDVSLYAHREYVTFAHCILCISQCSTPYY